MPQYRIVDLATGPFSLCGRLLAGLGMDVIKVEPPGGDPYRRRPPFAPGVGVPEASLPFSYLNAGKQGVVLDLDTESGQKGLAGLVSSADVVIESFSPTEMAGWGFGLEKLASGNRRLILASISGFGRAGPYRDFLYSDAAVQALGGWMHVTGSPEGPPLALPGDLAAATASLFGAMGILLALQARRGCARGQHIDISTQECVAATLDHALPRFFSTNEVASRSGSLYWNGAFAIVPCRRGHILVSLSQQWETIAGWLAAEGRAELSERRWEDPAFRRANVRRIVQVIESWARTRDAGELERQAQLMGLPWAAVSSASLVRSNKQLNARGFFVPLRLGGDRPYRVPGAPCLFQQSPWVRGGSAPKLGEHDRKILGAGSPQEPGNADATERVPPEGHASSRPKDQYELCNEFPRQDTRNASMRSGGGSDGSLPLSGIRILDFTRVLAGPYATRILADFGAEVIKVQLPGAEEKDVFGRAYYRMWNRNKLSISLDLSNPQGIATAKGLLRQCDVVIENFSPRVMDNWGLDYAGCRAVKEDIIMVGMSTFGHSGPCRDYVGFGPTVHAMSGLSRLTAYSRDAPDGPGFAYADHASGLVAAMAVLKALDYKAQTGRGQYVDVSAVEATCFMLGTGLLKTPESQQEGLSGLIVPLRRCYRCKGDEWCAVETGPGDVDALGLTETWTSQRSADEVMHLLQAARIPAGKVLDVAGLASDPQLSARKFLTFRQGDRSQIADANPIRMSGTPARYFRDAPDLNQDAEYVLKGLLGRASHPITPRKIKRAGTARE